MVLTKGANEIQASYSNKPLETKIDELTSLVRQLEVGKTQATRLCGIFTSYEHPTNTCLTLQEGVITDFPQAYATNILQSSKPQPV